MTIVKPTRKKRIFYAKDVNMNFSFDTLTKIAQKQLGASLTLGDLIVCDNKRKDKRKVMQYTSRGLMIYYGRLHEEEFKALANKDGQLKSLPSDSLF